MQQKNKGISLANTQAKELLNDAAKIPNSCDISKKIEGEIKAISRHLPLYNIVPEIQGFAEKIANVNQVDIDFATSSIYSVASAAMGNKITLTDPKGYTNSAALWVCHVAQSGYGKSPVEQVTIKPIINKKTTLDAEYKAALKEFKKSGDKTADPPQKKSVLVSDITPEALIKRLDENPDGLILYRDELSGWVEDFGRYNKSGELDTALSIWSGQSVSTTRIMREENSVKDPFLTIFGGTQSERLTKVWGKDCFLGSGFLARFLWVYPEIEITTNYYSGSISHELLKWWDDFIQRLYDAPPFNVTFSEKAKDIYIDYWLTLQKKKKGNENMAQIYSKLQIYCQKWALVTHYLKEENFQFGFEQKEIDALTMEMSIESMNIFAEWAEKVYRDIQEPQKKITSVELVKMIHEKYGIKNIAQFAESVGVSRQLISRAINKV